MSSGQWLYGGGPDALAEGSVAERAQALAAEIELDHDVPVELVVVGDHPGNEALAALLGAVREASVNAARHSGTDEVDVYLEIGPSAAVAFVRDKGCGFEPDAVAVDSHGITHSIRGRLERCGGPGAGGDDAGHRHGVGAGGAAVSAVGTAPPRVFVVDDHALFRAGVRAELGPSVTIVGDAGDVDDAIAGIVASQPDVVLLDVHLPGGGGPGGRGGGAEPGAGRPLPRAVGVRRRRGRARSHPLRRPRLRDEDDHP